MSQTPEQIRKDQVAAGRTLSLKEGYTPRPRNDFNKPKSHYNKGPRTTTPKGHDAVLKRIQESGEQVELILMSGDTVSGTIFARDKYTVTIAWTTNGQNAEDMHSIIYKHAIESIVTKAPTKQAETAVQ